MLDIDLIKMVKVVKEDSSKYSSDFINMLLEDVYVEMVDNTRLIIDLIDEI